MLLFSLAIFKVGGCKKVVDSTKLNSCEISGVYSGKAESSTGNMTILTYKFESNNFAVGSVTPAGAAVTFGGYRNTCDSVIMSVNYTSTGHYYLLQGKLSNGNATISGTFKNLTNTSDFGTFTITK